MRRTRASLGPRVGSRLGRILGPVLGAGIAALLLVAISARRGWQHRAAGDVPRPEPIPSAPSFTLARASASASVSEVVGLVAASTPASRGAPTGAVSASVPTMLHLDARHTNRSPFHAPRSPSLAWTIDVGAPIVTAPIVVEGHVVVTTLGGQVAAITPAGATRWVTTVGDRVYGSPLVIGGTIFVGVDVPPKPAKNGRVVALSAATGAIKWRLEIEGDADTAIAPLPEGSGIVLAAGRTIVAARLDGTVTWRFKARRKIQGSPAVAQDGTVYVGSQDDRAIAIGKNGELRWQASLGGDVDAAPAIGDDGTVFFGTDAGEVVALRPSDGAVIWRKQLGGFVRGPLSIARDGVVLASTYGPVPAIVALAPIEGAEIWRHTIRGTGAKEFGIHGSPLEDASGTLIFGAQDDHLIALDPDGKTLWTRLLGGDVDATVILASDGVLYAGCDDGKLYAFVEGEMPTPTP